MPSVSETISAGAQADNHIEYGVQSTQYGFLCVDSRERLYEPSGFKGLASRHPREAYPLIRLNHIRM